ncbi:MAG: helix-turn-helix domain-containing protein, partial [Proteobacteria bacterium]|nr:helix-turn-helix domain-containing protein [Pseudomonadota bacterium]
MSELGGARIQVSLRALVQGGLEVLVMELLRLGALSTEELLESFQGARLLRRIAAFEVREAIARDAEQAPQVRPILGQLRRHLFENRPWPPDADFRRLLGCDPTPYATRRRLEVACQLLRHTHLRVGEIAGLVGFSTSKGLSDALRRRQGMTPSRYRELHMPARLRDRWKRALAPVRWRIELDRTRAPRQLQPALARIGQGLLE